MNEPWRQVTIAPIVEGDGEVRALPKLLHRIALERGIIGLLTPTPMRVPKGKLTCPGGIERVVAAMAVRVTGAGGVLVLLDADDDCPAELGPQLLARARKARPDKQVVTVLANREFEAWYLAAAPSISGQYGFPGNLKRPDDPEGPQDCKGWLTRARGISIPYKETVDQAPLASIIDMTMARANSPSFDKFYRDVVFLLNAG